MKNLEELEQKYLELGKEIKRYTGRPKKKCSAILRQLF